MNTEHKATYSPDDNKIRIYPDCRLNTEEYQELKKAGFKWAPKQQLFVAPMWTPYREDIAIKYCSVIDDEDTTLVERQEERAERFEDYSAKRASDAENQIEQVKSITENIPFGQPILVGHHSEKRARRDKQKIDNSISYAVKMWKTSEYWQYRAAGALRHAKYKELPNVRARRIKKIEAEKRKRERNISKAEKFIEYWSMEGLTKEKASIIAGYGFGYYKKSDGIEVPLYRAIEQELISIEDARDTNIKEHKSSIAFQERWIEHLNNRLVYEKAMLDDQGASHLIEKKPRPKQLPLLNYEAPEGILTFNRWGDEPTKYNQVGMTRAEYKAIYSDARWCEHSADKTHRVRVYVKYSGGMTREKYCVFLTDSKVHKRPEPEEPKKREIKRPIESRHIPIETPKPKSDLKEKIEELKNNNKELKFVHADQFYPTPDSIACAMADRLGIQETDKILEPSAGSGALVNAVIKAGAKPDNITAIEINCELKNSLTHLNLGNLIRDDFLSCNGNIGSFDKIIMNPPFKNGIDIKHVLHAFDHLKPGGKLVSLCASGPRQRIKFNELINMHGGEWRDLPAGSFKQQGTNVNVALVTIKKQIDIHESTLTLITED